jgi:hypothetical protein
MGIDTFNRVVRHLRGRAQVGDDLSDGELLERYRAPNAERRGARRLLLGTAGPRSLGTLGALTLRIANVG